MNKLNTKKRLPFIIFTAILLSTSLAFTGCAKQDTQTTKTPTPITASTDAKEPTSLGKGNISFPLVVTTADKKNSYFKINTDKTTVGEALLDTGLVEGTKGEHGLYIKTVNGITADFDKDKSYWAFYINDKYADTGVDSTQIDDKSTYALKVEK